MEEIQVCKRLFSVLKQKNVQYRISMSKNQFQVLNIEVMLVMFQKHLIEVFHVKRCCQKFGKIHRKTTAPHFFFNKVATLSKKRLALAFFSEFYEIFQNTFGRLFVMFQIVTLFASVLKISDLVTSSPTKFLRAWHLLQSN